MCAKRAAPQKPGSPDVPPLRGKGPTPAWGDQSVEERIPSFLEVLYFETRRRLFSPVQRPD
jgi:hypothetical protein